MVRGLTRFVVDCETLLRIAADHSRATGDDVRALTQSL
jgi:hypothetical protein